MIKNLKFSTPILFITLTTVGTKQHTLKDASNKKQSFNTQRRVKQKSEQN